MHCLAMLAPMTLTYLSPAASFAWASAFAQSSTYVTPASGADGGRCVTTYAGPLQPPPNASPSPASPLYGSSPSCERRPISSDPIRGIRSSTSGLGPRYG